MIRIVTIGTAEVHVGVSRISRDSAVLFGLALFLGLTAGERIPRTRLLELLWARADDTTRHALRQLLYRLRRAGVPFLLDGEELLIDPSCVDADLTRLLDPAWIDAADGAAVAAAADVLPGYTPPLPEMFREWVDGLRSRSTAQYRRAAIRQIALTRREGRWADVDLWSRRCLDVDPLNEEATLARAEAVAMTGAKTEALRILDEYLVELGDRERVIGLPAKVLRRRVSEYGHDRVGTVNDGSVLVGRGAELARLNDVLRATLSGTGTTAFVVGAAGIGKSRLAQELLAGARMSGWAAVSAHLQSSDRQRPMGLFVDLFSTLLRQPGALGCAPAPLMQLRKLTQHDVEDAGSAQLSQEAEAVRERIRLAGVELLAALVHEGPLVVLLEDLHWCDDASSLLLQYLVSKTRSLPVCWVLSARPEGAFPALRELLGEEHVQGVRLEPLAPADAGTLFRTLVRRRCDREAPDNTVPEEVAAALTGGNPFFIRELARHVAGTGGAASLPHSLRSLILDRVARLSPLAQHVLHACAVLGRYSSVPRVASVLEIGTSELLAGIRELDALGIVGGGSDVESLSLHDLWQEELLRSLQAASRQLIHYRCGIVLEAESQASHSAAAMWEASRHLIASGSRARALRALEDCAQHLNDNGLPADAARTWELAYEAAETDADRLKALSGRVASLHRAADWTALAEAVEPAIALSRLCGATTGRHSELELLQTELLWRTETDSVECLNRALACTLDDVASLRHRTQAALLAAIASDNLCKTAELQRVFQISEGLPRSERGDIVHWLAVSTIYHTSVGCPATATKAAEELVALERELGSVHALGRALRFAAYPHRVLGNFGRAIEVAREALELAERHRLVGDAAAAADAIVSIHLDREDAKTAHTWIERAEFWATKVGARYAQTSLNLSRARIALMNGDAAAASRLVSYDIEKHAVDPIMRQRLSNVSVLVRLFIVEARFRELARAVAVLADSLSISATTGRQDYFAATLTVGLAALKRPSEAREFAREYLSHSRRDKGPPFAELLAYG